MASGLPESLQGPSRPKDTSDDGKRIAQTRANASGSVGPPTGLANVGVRLARDPDFAMRVALTLAAIGAAVFIWQMVKD